MSGELAVSRAPPLHLYDLPSEIFHLMISLTVGYHDVFIDVAHPHKRKLLWRQGTARYELLRYGFPKEFIPLVGALGTDRRIRTQTTAAISQQLTFQCNTAEILKLPRGLGSEWLAKIGTLYMNMHFEAKCFRDRIWPELYDMIKKNMTGLTELYIYSTHLPGLPAYPEDESGDPAGSVSRRDQELRNLLSFAAFGAVRGLGTGLNRVIVPATSGPSFENDRDRVTTTVILDRSYIERPGDKCRVWSVERRWKDETRSEKVTKEDRVINAAVARHLRPTALANTALDVLTIHPGRGQTKDDIPTSEVALKDDLYKLVDERGYLHPEKLEGNDIRYNSVAELIDVCEKSVNIAKMDGTSQALALEKAELQLDRQAYKQAHALSEQRSRDWQERANASQEELHRTQVTVGAFSAELGVERLRAADAERKVKEMQNELKEILRELRWGRRVAAKFEDFQWKIGDRMANSRAEIRLLKAAVEADEAATGLGGCEAILGSEM